MYTLVRVHLEVEIGEEELAEVEQSYIDVSAANNHEPPYLARALSSLA